MPSRLRRKCFQAIILYPAILSVQKENKNIFRHVKYQKKKNEKKIWDLGKGSSDTGQRQIPQDDGEGKLNSLS